MITNYTKDEIQKNIDSETQIINSYLSIQMNLINQISVFLNSNFEKEYVNNALVNINKSKQNTTLLKNLLDILKNLENISEFLTDEGLESFINDYNELYKTNISLVFSKTLEIENFIHEISLNIPYTSQENNNFENSGDINFSSSYNLVLDNTLIISETKNKVILPFNLEDLKLYFNTHINEYNSIGELVEEKYSFPLSHFKPAPISRFREAYNLMKNKENSSKINALSLAFELLFNYNLHPAIIRACKNLDELDIYLSCLEDNDLESFKKFAIKYEATPVISKKLKKLNKNNITQLT